jgi:hypothetical protein
MGPAATSFAAQRQEIYTPFIFNNRVNTFYYEKFFSCYGAPLTG